MCIFCRIVAGELPARVVRSDSDTLVFHDIEPQAPVHMLVVPRRHIESLDEAEDADRELLARLLWSAREAAREAGIAGSGYRLVLNNGPDGLQSVGHVHIHVLGGRKMGWPPG